MGFETGVNGPFRTHEATQVQLMLAESYLSSSPSVPPHSRAQRAGPPPCAAFRLVAESPVLRMPKAFRRRHESPVLCMGEILSCDWLDGRVELTEIPHSAGFSSSATRVRQSTRPPSRARKFNSERGVSRVRHESDASSVRRTRVGLKSI
uniref:Uncharacterized protein n=1 Tax=Sphaerodactylus townsendi TaxID=933632 RepID=A0ACB8FJJ4_9SAUR